MTADKEHTTISPTTTHGESHSRGGEPARAIADIQDFPASSMLEMNGAVRDTTRRPTALHEARNLLSKMLIAVTLCWRIN